MAALPVPFIDTGITATHTLSLETIVRAQVPSGNIYLDLSEQENPTFLFTRALTALHGRTDLVEGGGSGIDTAADIELVLEYGPGPTQVVLQTLTGIPNTGTPPTFTAVLTTRTDGTLRLGVALDAEGRLVYEWFKDAGTTLTTVIGGTTVQTKNEVDPPVSLGGSGRLFWYLIATDALVSAAYRVRFEDLLFGAVPAGAGAYEFKVGDTVGRSFGPPWNYTVDARVVDEDGANLAGVDLTHQEVARNSGTWTITRLVDMSGPPIPLTEPVTAPVLTNPWLGNQTIRPPETEWSLVFEGNNPKNPGSAFTSWNVGDLTISSPVSVLLDAGGTWNLTGPVTASASVPPFNLVVAGGGAEAERVLSEHWRAWNTPGDPDEEPDDQFTTTKHDFYASGSGDDVWGWSGYAYLELVFSAAPAGSITLSLSWVVIRQDNTEMAVTRTYTVPVTGAGTYTVDLLLPNEGDVPFHGERVDALTFKSLAVGTYTVTQVRLKTVEDAYVRLGARSPSDRGGLVISQDGQFVFSQWGGDVELEGGDQNGDSLPDFAKDDQNGIYEVASSETADAALEWLGGAAGMLQAFLPDWFTEAHALEGLAAVYDGTAIGPALTDTDGQVLLTLTEIPDYWMLPNQPGERLADGTPLDVFARLVVTDILVPAGRTTGNTFAYARARLGLVAESQGVISGRARTGAGVTTRARAYVLSSLVAVDPVLATGTTDAGGFADLPIRNGDYKIGPGEFLPFWVYVEGG